MLLWSVSIVTQNMFFQLLLFKLNVVLMLRYFSCAYSIAFSELQNDLKMYIQNPITYIMKSDTYHICSTCFKGEAQFTCYINM